MISDITGIILIDHGSKRTAANAQLLEVVSLFQKTSGARIVEPAHMELADPTLAEAYAACVEQGATEIIIHPYFLAPGRHSTSDIPRLAEEAAALYPLIPYRITKPLGVDTRICEVIQQRIDDAGQ
ncbi:MAG: cobalamin biosynthesis protein CbiX [Candidatus Hydrogenedentota bacterium]|nr:MAG: cobalamin biosynthesis protein CbiX [Candidatus Hydrogenedentota bacterium]